MATSEYSRKRNFDRTPEPKPGKRAPFPANSFVVHRHEARRLHYDFRIGATDRLASWAVPKGFSYNPGEKRLAVKTEDHPIEYLEFEGLIPRGEYGAGTIEIWDRGFYRLVKAERIEEAIAKGEVKLSLSGRRLRGEWHLVRTKEDNWLLFKAKDVYARDGDGLLPGSIDSAELEAEALPLEFEPMIPIQSVPPFSDPEWVYELDFEGMRAFIGKDNGKPFLRVWKQIDTAPLLEVLRGELGKLGCESVLLDAVLVALDDAGRPSRDKLSNAWVTNPESISVYLLDILHWDGYSTRNLDLPERKALLRSILPASDTLLYTDPIVERGESLALEACRAGIESLIAKKSHSSYTPGPSGQWRRIVIAGAGKQSSPGSDGTAGSSPRVKPSNPNKIFWPEQGYTKKDLCDYYYAVAEYIVPHLRGRPVHLHRYPNGIGGKDFFQRQAPEHAPAWVHRVEFGEKGEQYILCDDRRTLLYLVNLGSIDLHPWLSRADSPDKPDWAVLDIDAKDSSFADAANIARKTGSLLRGLGIRSFVKTSGATGLHIFVPLRASYSYEQSRIFAEAIARVVVMENRRTATIERNPQKRSGKVYVDFLQNRRGQTIVPPYCVRPVPGAQVSMPLNWDELRTDLSPNHFTLRNAGNRIRETGDLFRPVLEMEQDLLPAVASLEDYMRGDRPG